MCEKNEKRVEIPTLAVENHLADPMQRYVLEVTINHPQDKKYMVMPLDSKIERLKGLFNKIVNHTKADRDQSKCMIEFCKTGVPHIHGYVMFETPIGAIFYEEGIMTEIARQVYLCLPRSSFKYWVRNHYERHIRRWKSPALCLNLKNVLGDGWTSYVNKYAPNADINWDLFI